MFSLTQVSVRIDQRGQTLNSLKRFTVLHEINLIIKDATSYESIIKFSFLDYSYVILAGQRSHSLIINVCLYAIFDIEVFINI